MYYALEKPQREFVRSIKIQINTDQQISVSVNPQCSYQLPIGFCEQKEVNMCSKISFRNLIWEFSTTDMSSDIDTMHVVLE